MLDENEIAVLAARYGQPVRWARTLDVSKNQTRVPFRQRSAEIVLVIPRPQQRVLLHTKDFYPPAAYRLPTGGIEDGEQISAAARRELGEETGLPIDLAQFIGIVEYTFIERRGRTRFVSYVWLTERADAAPQAVDADEHISEFREVEWRELENVAQALERLPGDWGDWGRWRAIPHRLVLAAMADGKIQNPKSKS